MDKVSPAHHAWIAENLLNGSDPQAIITRMVQDGFAEQEAIEAVVAAQEHPYLKIAIDLRIKLQKRDALLATLDHYQRMDPGYLNLESKELPPFEIFIRDYYSKNRPGLFRGAANHWPARQWTPQKLAERIGADTVVEVQANRERNKNYQLETALHKSEMRFGDFIRDVESKATNDIYLTANNEVLRHMPFKALLEDAGELGDGYLDTSLYDDRAFLWIGPKGTITPLHHDRTNNFFVQLYGQKRFRLFPALQAPFMYNHVGVFSQVDLLDVDPGKFPLFGRAQMIDVVIGPGDFLFIPLGWWHHVMSESVNIGLSFTNVRHENYFFDYPEHA